METPARGDDARRDKLKGYERHEPAPLTPNLVARMNEIRREADTLPRAQK